MDDLLVDEVSDHLDRGLALEFVAASVGFFELGDDSVDDKTDDIGEFCVHCGE